MANITLTIRGEDLAAAVTKILSREPSALGGNPLAKLVVDALTEFVASDEFARSIRAIYRDALRGEASRMGVNAARAAVNAKEESRG